MEENGERDRLLDTADAAPDAEQDEGGVLRRVASNRFQVSRTGGPEKIEEPADGVDVVQVRMQKSVSEPPLPLEITDRKMSANGRFMVSTDAFDSKKITQHEEPAHNEVDSVEESDDDFDGAVVSDWGFGGQTDENQDTQTDSTLTQQKAKGVHFSVGERNAEEMKKQASTENTVNMKSWRNMKTLEHPPIMDFYRNSIDVDHQAMRPSMTQLINGSKAIPEDMAIEDFKIHNDVLVEGQMDSSDRKDKVKTRVEKFCPPPQQARKKFGWFEGVFMRCLLNIFGVMLYLRISWVAGQAGIGLGSLIVLLASTVTTITALSMCAICTNGHVKGGGAYFLISRSLGPEFGGSIGLIFSVANAVGGAMYIVGFAETVRDLVKEVFGVPIIDGGLWDVRVIGFATCFILMGIIFIGTSFESKMQLGLLVILLLSIVNYAIGSFIYPNSETARKGMTGYSWATLVENLGPDFRSGESFFSVFSVYFPAATGIMAGANISGDLADPQYAIPVGTLRAIASTTVIYLITVWMTGSTCVRYASGDVLNMTMDGALMLLDPSDRPDCAANNECPFGLMTYFQVMEMSSVWGPLITAGIFAATLSSALASLVSAPKVFQAVCRDRLFPKIGYFAKSYGKDEEPRRAYGLAFIICIGIICIGELNAIAPIISNFFLASYALLNYACFDASFADSPGFRPGFKYYSMWISLVGALMCVVVMFIISWWTALMTFFCFGALFLYILHRKPDVNWGSSTQAHSYKNALAGMIKLANTEEHVKNYRPQFLVLSGNPAARPSLVDFVNNITKGSSLMLCGYVIPYRPSARVFSVMKMLDHQLNQWLRKRHVKAFYVAAASPSLREGAQSLLQAAGLGRLRPNIVLLGFKANWYRGGPTKEICDELCDYFGVIQDSFDRGMSVCLLRNSDMGLDFSEAMKQLNIGEASRLNLPDCSVKINEALNGNEATAEGTLSVAGDQKISEVGKDDSTCLTTTIAHKDSARSMERFAKESDHCIAATNSMQDNFPFEDFEGDADAEEGEIGLKKLDAEPEEKESKDEVDMEEGDKRKDNYTFSLRRRNSRRPTMEQKALLASISRFQKKLKKGTIDVWWLYDDGGLTLLIPHLLTIPKSYLEGAQLRVFTISTSTKGMENEQRLMATLLSKFRIDFANVSIISDIGRKPRKDTMERWERLIEPWIGADDDDMMPGLTSRSELDAQREKTCRQLRTAELLEENSSQADLIVMTLPVPRKGLVSASLYLSWLDIMTRGLPPTLLVRGNQQSVLTFYS